MSYPRATKSRGQGQQDQTPEEQSERGIQDDRRSHSGSSISSPSISNSYPNRLFSSSPVSITPTPSETQALPPNNDLPPSYSPWDPSAAPNISRGSIVGGTEGQPRSPDHAHSYPPEKNRNGHDTDTDHRRRGGYWQQESGENSSGGLANCGGVMDDTVNAPGSGVPPSHSDWMDDVGMGMGIGMESKLKRMSSRASVSGMYSSLSN